MEVDLDAERAVSRERVEQRDHEFKLTYRSRILRTEAVGADLADTARELWPHFSEEERAEIVQRAAQPEEARHVKPLSKDRVTELAREHLKKEPQATTREVWRKIVKVGQPAIKDSTFGAMVMPKVRKELGIIFERGGRPQHASAAPQTPAPAPARPDPDTVSIRLVSEQEKEEEDERPPVAVTARADSFSEGDRIVMEIGGERLEATRKESRWDVEFDGKLEDQMMAGIMARMLAGVRG